MAWKATGQPTVRKQRDKWVVWVDGIESGLGAIQLSLLDRDDVATWISNLAAGGKLSRRGVQICRNVLRASLREAVDEGLIPRSPAARVGLPRTVAKPDRVKETDAWTAAEVDCFLDASASHRWAVGFRLGVLYGLRRSEILALRWDDLDTKAATLRIDESLVAARTGVAWSNAENERSRRIIPLDDETLRDCARRRSAQAADRRPRRIAGHRRPARTQPRDADEHLRACNAEEPVGGHGANRSPDHLTGSPEISQGRASRRSLGDRAGWPARHA